MLEDFLSWNMRGIVGKCCLLENGGRCLGIELQSYSGLLFELSLTCSSFGCEHNWSLFEIVIEVIYNL